MEDDAMATPFCQDLKRFIMTFVSTTAEAIQATQGAGGLMIMSVAIGTRLWEEMEQFKECDMPGFETRDEKINCFMKTAEASGGDRRLLLRGEGGPARRHHKRMLLRSRQRRQIEVGLPPPLPHRRSYRRGAP